MSPRGRSSVRVCDLPDCGRPHMAKGVCCMHYRRFVKFGSYDLPPQMTTEDRLWARVIKGGPDECWLWTGPTHTQGYGRLSDGSGDDRKVYAHRLSYEIAHGPIPDGLVIDHICHNNSGCSGNETCQHRRCVNPAHLEAVTDAVNSLRGEGPRVKLHRAGTCINGHPVPPRLSGKAKPCPACTEERKMNQQGESDAA